MRADRVAGSPWARSLAIAAAALTLLILPASAVAAVSSQLWQSPLDGVAGEGAGQLDLPEAIAADPVSGHTYVAEFRNARVSEFDAWGAFVKAWGWGVENGSSELQTCGPPEPDPEPAPGLCRKGTSGAGPGQFANLRGGVVVGAEQNVFVGDLENSRVQKFDSDGNFLLQFGSPGEGDGQFESKIFGDRMAVGPTGTIFVGDNKGRIQEFEPDGSFKSKVTLEGELNGKPVLSLDIDPDGNFYVIASGEGGAGVQKFSPAGVLLDRFADAKELDELSPGTKLSSESPLTLDAGGNVYVSTVDSSGRYEAVKFSASGVPLIPPGSGLARLEEGVVLAGLATNVVTASGESNLYLTATTGQGISFTSAYGTPPDKWDPPKRPPQVKAQYALAVDPEGAVIGAEINPRFWDDARYYAEWGTGKCSEGGCPNTTPLPPGSLLGAGIVNAPSTTKGVLLSGLAPATTYHYRFVSESSGGGPTVGTDPDGEGPAEANLAEGGEATFTTPALPQPQAGSCANEEFRTGPSARLPDCRAYELVSPLDKNNTDIYPLQNINSNPAALNQAALSGEKLTYTTSQGFGDTRGVPYVSQYIASRDPSQGWSSDAITPPQGISPVEISGRIDVEFRAFTEDLCESALLHTTDLLLAPEAQVGFPNIYRRENCGPAADSYTAATTTEPPNTKPANFLPTVRGLSGDGRCVAFGFPDQLTPEAIPGPALSQIYYSCEGQPLRLLSVLPNGTATPTSSAVGTVPAPLQGFRNSPTASAVSQDGARVYWTNAHEGPEKLYLRLNPDQEQSAIAAGQCTEPEKACTLKVSETVASGRASFWAASEDGGRALFTLEGASNIANGGAAKLYDYELAQEDSTLIANEVTGVLGASKDAQRIYFLSKAQLTSGPNAEGMTPTKGKANLYLFDADREGGDRYRFIATLAPSDANVITNATHPSVLTPVNLESFKKTSRVSADGHGLAFMSAAPLTGYDNLDSQSGKADAEVFAYRAEANGGEGALHCLSCNPTNQRPRGRAVLTEEQDVLVTWAAALLPVYATELYGSRVISQDGNRVYFNSFEALIPTDTNGKADVYQWQAPGSGTCTEQSPSYSPPNGGCLDLISSGESPSDSAFVDASADGADVFLATDSSLISQDPGLVDIYDARVGGGFPPPPPPIAPCEGEACQGPPAPPNDPTPGSLSFRGAGNVKQTKPRPCPKGKVRRKGRCVKKHKGRATDKARAHKPRSEHDRNR